MPDIIHAFGRTWLPDWATSLLLLAGGAGLAFTLHQAVFAVIERRLIDRRSLLMTALVKRTIGPARLALMIVGVAVAASFAPMTSDLLGLLRHGLLIAFIVLIGWAAAAALHVWTVVYSRRFKIDVEDNLAARKHITQVRILERTATAFIVLLTVAAALMTIGPVRQYGVTLLASAGAAGIIAGLALQPLLTNLIAGVQIAVTQPIRIDDAVIVENEWGWVEEIGGTYVVVRLWDLRRMILPLSYFIQKPFQNWTRESAKIIGTVMVYVDYTAPVEAMRVRLTEIVRASPRWDGDVVNLAVTDLKEKTMEVRCLMSAKNAGEAFDLRCEVREQMLAWLCESHPKTLPRERRTVEILAQDMRPEWPRPR